MQTLTYGDNIIQAIIIVLIIVLFYSFYQQYLIDSESTTITWEVEKPYEIYLKLKEKFGQPSSIKIDNISGVIWTPDKIFKKIILLDQERNLLIITIPIKLFAGYKNIQMTRKAVHNKLSQITGLSETINYDTFTESATLKCDTWENALILSVLLTKISTSELTLKEIQKNHLIEQYVKDNSEHNYYQELNDYETFYLSNTG
jgi:hypothetical protein